MRTQNHNRSTPPVCPNCGADVPRNALACPECGSDADTGWKDHGFNAGSELPEDEFDYDEAFLKEFESEIIPHHIKPIWWITGIVLLALVVIGLVRTVMR